MENNEKKEALTADEKAIMLLRDVKHYYQLSPEDLQECIENQPNPISLLFEKFGKWYADQQTSALQEENKKLREAINEISQMPDATMKLDYIQTIRKMKRIAKEAINPKDK